MNKLVKRTALILSLCLLLSVLPAASAETKESLAVAFTRK